MPSQASLLYAKATGVFMVSPEHSMNRRIQLLTAQLHYGPDIALHTAASGAIPFLDELYLMIEDSSRVAAIGGIRHNIQYLTGMSSDEILGQVKTWAAKTDWSLSFDSLLDNVHADKTLSSPAIALFDLSFHDGLARQQGIPISQLWGVSNTEGIETNQTLFWCDDATLLKRAEKYVTRGFTTLKLRMGIGSFETDMNRLALLRERFGNKIKLSADVNGQWQDEVALAQILALQKFDLDYLEQPVSRSSWETLSKLAAQSPITIMLDESVASDADIDRIIAIGGKLAAHLKLVKCGGLRPLISAGQKLIAAGIPVMIGQMNEGALATAAAAHAAIVLGTTDNELYGADGLLDDPAETPRYANGQVFLTDAPGIGQKFNPSKLEKCWERTISTHINDTTQQSHLHQQGDRP